MKATCTPMMAVVNGLTVVAGQPPDATAFNSVFGLGVVLTVAAALLSSLIRNYTFRDATLGPPKPPG